MKTTLTVEQSAELIKRGVSEDIVTTIIPVVNGRGFVYKYSPIFTLTDILSLLPKKITFGHRTNCRLKIQPIISSKDRISEVWQACYLHTSLKANAEATELIDALYKLLLWAIDHNHVKLD